jgi:hypothetical protein
MMSSNYCYKLVGKEAVPCDFDAWASFFFDPAHLSERQVAYDYLGGGVRVCTTFIGVVTNPRGKPLLFETLVRGGPRDCETRKYATWAEAADGHARLVAELCGCAS